MDTDEKYLNDEFYVCLAGETPPDFIIDISKERRKEKIEDPDSPLVGPEEYEPSEARDHHYLNDDVDVDGWVTFYDPELLEDHEPFKHGTFPFRNHNKGDQWFARPDSDEWDRHPVWKWTNPDEDPHENLTLEPSIGKRSDGGVNFHCFIRNGEIEWV